MQVLDLLCHLLTKDFVDFSDGEEGADTLGPGAAVDCPGVVFLGLGTVLPLVSAGTLCCCPARDTRTMPISM